MITITPQSRCQSSHWIEYLCAIIIIIIINRIQNKQIEIEIQMTVYQLHNYSRFLVVVPAATMYGLSYLPIGWNRRLNFDGNMEPHETTIWLKSYAYQFFWRNHFDLHRGIKQKKTTEKWFYIWMCVCVCMGCMGVRLCDRCFQLMAFAILRVARARRAKWFALLFVFKKWRLHLYTRLWSAYEQRDLK